MDQLSIVQNNQIIKKQDGNEYVDGSSLPVPIDKGFKHTEKIEKAIIHISPDLREEFGYEVGEVIEIEANGYRVDHEIQGSRPDDKGLVRINRIGRLALGVVEGEMVKLPLTETLCLTLDNSYSMDDRIGK